MNSVFSIQNLTNAFISVVGSSEKLIIDPWLNDGIYAGTWHNFPRLSELEKINALKNVDVCMYTHIHKDHFNIETAIKYLKLTTKFLIPKVFGWQVMYNDLKKNGFENLEVIICNKDIYETKEFKITAIPPINVSGLESEKINELSIDSGFLIINKKNNVKCIFLADDNLYADDRIQENLDLLKGADLIGFAYSGFASEYPYKFNFSDEKMVEICKKNEEKRFNIQLKNLKIIKPKCILPYSSEFVAIGDHAKKWRQILGKIWTSNKIDVARRYSEALGVDGIALYPNDIVYFDSKGRRFDDISKFDDNGPYSYKSLLDYANKYSIKSDIKISNKNFKSFKELKHVLSIASKNYQSAISRLKLTPKQNLIIKIRDKILGIIDKKGSFIFDVKANNIGKEPFLELNIEPGFLTRLLEGNLHWNDACLSLKITWKRQPNIFCSDTLNALNYLKL